MPLDYPPGSPLKARLRRETQGEVLFAAFRRGRYATNASVYQIELLGVVVSKSREDAAAIAIAGGGGAGIAARRRHLATRGDRGAGTRRRSQLISRPGDRDRCRATAGGVELGWCSKAINWRFRLSPEERRHPLLARVTQWLLIRRAIASSIAPRPLGISP